MHSKLVYYTNDTTLFVKNHSCDQIFAIGYKKTQKIPKIAWGYV